MAAGFVRFDSFGAFFPAHGGSVLWSLYVMGIVLAIGMGYLFKKTIFKGEAPMFIMVRFSVLSLFPNREEAWDLFVTGFDSVGVCPSSRAALPALTPDVSAFRSGRLKGKTG
jgi:hypothetical protein